MEFYTFIEALCRFIVYTFFSEVKVIGKESIPHYGPTIFVGNHYNKFVDAILFIACIPRRIRFLVALKTMKKGLIGYFCRLLNSIPIIRPDDIKKFGSGMLMDLHNLKSLNVQEIKFPLSEAAKNKFQEYADKIKEQNIDNLKSSDFKTWGICQGDQKVQFLNELRDGYTIRFNTQILTVKCVLSNDLLVVQTTSEAITVISELLPTQFFYAPKTNQTAVYESVNISLMNNQSIGLFPEGGSHDRPGLLPMKPGVAIMALSAASLGVEDILVIPCGIHYLKRDKFNSKAILEVGKPIQIKEEDVTLFNSPQRSLAIQKLLDEIKKNLEDCIVCANDFETLKVIDIAAKLYVPNRDKITTDKDHTLQTLFTKILRLTEELDITKKFKDDLLDYQRLLDYNGITDSEVFLLNIDTQTAFYHMIGSSIYLAFIVLLSLPTFIITRPIKYLSDIMTEKHRKKCTAENSLKIHGKDVIASYKLVWFILAVPILCVIISLPIVYFFSNSFFGFILVTITVFTILPLVLYKSVLLQQKIIPLVNYISCCMRVFKGGISVAHKMEFAFLADRIDVQLNVRNYVNEIVSADFRKKHPEWDQELQNIRYQFEQLISFIVIDADTNRLKRSKNKLYTPLINMKIYDKEEII